MAAALAWIAGSGVVQGVIIGGVLAFLTAVLIMNAVARSATTTVNGWNAIRACGQPGNGVLLRAACAKALPVVNVFEEAAYWTTAMDASKHTLTGAHDYVLHFEPGQVPPNDAFWSLTVTDIAGYMVRNPVNRYSVGDRLDLAENADGSIDIRLQQTEPSGPQQNWLPTPAGRFKLMLRAYLPGEGVLDGTYRVPPARRAESMTERSHEGRGLGGAKR